MTLCLPFPALSDTNSLLNSLSGAIICHPQLVNVIYQLVMSPYVNW